MAKKKKKVGPLVGKFVALTEGDQWEPATYKKGFSTPEAAVEDLMDAVGDDFVPGEDVYVVQVVKVGTVKVKASIE